MRLSDKRAIRLKDFLDQKVEQYNTIDFIANDPISIPHNFSRHQDKEIMGFFAAIFAWGLRKTIINKCNELADRFSNEPYHFILNHADTDLKQLLGFKHRTFNDTDLLYCVHFLKHHYSQNESLETAFVPHQGCSIEQALTHFRQQFFSLPYASQRTAKHIPSPQQGSACKRLNMYLRWMVRKDDKGVDFGIWNQLQMKDLICPLDVHVQRTAQLLGLVSGNKSDWKTAIALRDNLRILDPHDPAKYDYALFGISIEEKCLIDMGVRK